jgi:replicative DNA helicase
LEGRGAKVYLVDVKPYNDVNEVLQALGPAGLRQYLDTAFENATHEALSDLLYIRETFLDLLDRRAERTEPYYSTGLEPLDKLLGGGYLEGLHLVCGITGGGKTSFALHLAVHNALAGKPVIYGSYEQPRFELWARIASQLTGVPYAAIKRGSYDDKGLSVRTSSQLKNDEGWEKLELLAKHLKIFEGGDAFSRKQGIYTLKVLAQTATRVAEERGAPPLVIIDQECRP